MRDLWVDDRFYILFMGEHRYSKNNLKDRNRPDQHPMVVLKIPSIVGLIKKFRKTDQT